MVPELEFQLAIPFEKVENEIPPNTKVPNEVRAARESVVRQIPQKNPNTQIWHGNEFPIFIAV